MQAGLGFEPALKLLARASIEAEGETGDKNSEGA
jgi:hypothetical protein